jgi:vacuolar-type H+-ATPase subunit E/Vma4
MDPVRDPARDAERALERLVERLERTLERLGTRIERRSVEDADRLIETLEDLGVRIPEGVREGVIANLEHGRKTREAMKRGLEALDELDFARGPVVSQSGLYGKRG